MLLPFESTQPPKVLFDRNGNRTIDVPPYHRMWVTSYLDNLESLLTVNTHTTSGDEASVTSFRVRDTPISLSGIHRICNCLTTHHKQSLRSFEMSNCQLTDGHIPILAKLIQECKVLEMISIRLNEFSPEGLKQLEDCIETQSVSPLLTTVFLDNITLQCEKIKRNIIAANQSKRMQQSKQWEQSLETRRQQEHWELQRKRARDQIDMKEACVREDIIWDWESTMIELRGYNKKAASALSLDVIYEMSTKLLGQEGRARDVVLGDQLYEWSQLVRLGIMMRLESENLTLRRKEKERRGAMETVETHLRNEVLEKQLLLRREIVTIWNKETQKVIAKQLAAVMRCERAAREGTLLAEESTLRNYYRAEFKLIRDCIKTRLSTTHTENIRRSTLRQQFSSRIIITNTTPTTPTSNRLSLLNLAPEGDEEQVCRRQIEYDSVAELKLI
eukprot:PhF_6_TR36549/c0_g1_i1/m.53917